MRVNKLDEEYLSQLVFINSKENKLDECRKDTINWLKDKYVEKTILLSG